MSGFERFQGIKRRWRECLSIEIGMSKEQELEKFKEWQGSKKTCTYCIEEGYNLAGYCPVRLICEEAKTGKEDIGHGKKSCHSAA